VTPKPTDNRDQSEKKISSGVAEEGGGLSNHFRDLRAGWLARLILLAVPWATAKKEGEARRDPLVEEEEETLGLLRLHFKGIMRGVMERIAGVDEVEVRVSIGVGVVVAALALRATM
jgi:hypothetical protein